MISLVPGDPFFKKYLHINRTTFKKYVKTNFNLDFYLENWYLQGRAFRMVTGSTPWRAHRTNNSLNCRFGPTHGVG